MMEFERLIIENLSWLHKKAFQFCPNKFDADDLTHETVERMLSNRKNYDFKKSFRPWAIVIMQNIYINQYKRSRRMSIVSLNEGYECISPCYADNIMKLSNILSIVRTCARKSIAIECVVLYAKGYNYKEISRMLKIPIGTVMSRICNGRKILLKAFD